MIVRRVLANIAPGSTPAKRKAASLGAEGQIRVPGGGAAGLPSQPGPPAPKKKKSSKGKKRAAAKASSSSSSSAGSDSSSDSDPELTVVVDAAPSRAAGASLADMPAVLGSGAAFAALVAARCERSWAPLSVIENAVPIAYRCHLIRSKMWSSKERLAYDKLVKGQRRERHRGQRRENPVLVACPHRLSFAFSNDGAVALEAQHLAMVCAGENFSDWAGDDGPKFGGSRGKAEYEFMLKELRTSWDLLSQAVELRQHVGAPASSTLFARVFALLERRYERFAAILSPGRAREEVLANVARQLAEIRVYFAAFNRSLADRCERKPYEEQALFASSRYVTLLGPLVAFLLDADDGAYEPAPPLGSLGGAAGGGAFGVGLGGGRAGRSVGATPPAARRTLAPGFADGAPPSVLPHPSPAPQPAFYPASPGQGGWPGYPQYSIHPPAYYPPSGAAFSPPPSAHPPPPATPGQWSGYAGPISSSPPAPAPAPSQAVAQPRTAVKTEPSGAGGGFLSQPMHVYVTGVGYNCVPAGEVRSPACGCGAKHGPNYRPGPHATWDCPFRYMARYGSCPGFLANGQRDPSHWHNDSLTRRAKDLWVKMIKDHNLGLPLGPDYRPVNFSL
jgi:hypothetical protein